MSCKIASDLFVVILTFASDSFENILNFQRVNKLFYSLVSKHFFANLFSHLLFENEQPVQQNIREFIYNKYWGTFHLVPLPIAIKYFKNVLSVSSQQLDKEINIALFGNGRVGKWSLCYRYAFDKIVSFFSYTCFFLQLLSD